MYFIYVDESGDVGLNRSPTRYFALSGFVVHELSWHDTLEKLIQFRRKLKNDYGLKLREEIHAAHFIHNPGELQRIPKSLRLRLLRDVIDFQTSLPDVNILNVVVDKQGKSAGTDIFEMAWQTLIQRFQNTIQNKNLPGPKNEHERGMLVVDRTDEKKLRLLSRKMRRYNPVPSSAGSGFLLKPITMVVEDAVHRDSIHSYYIQLADVNAYFLLQKHDPCSYIKRKGGRNYFDRLDSVLCKLASSKDPQGIVRR